MPPRSPRSVLWRYFTKVANDTSQCDICLRKLRTSGNTTNLHSHLKHKHPEQHIELYPDFSPAVKSRKIRKQVTYKSLTKSPQNHQKDRDIEEYESDNNYRLDVLSPQTPSTSSSQEPNCLKGSSTYKANRRKRTNVDNLSQAVQQLQEISQNIQNTDTNTDTNEHDAFGDYVAATLKKLNPSDAIMAQHEMQEILYKYRIGQCSESAGPSIIIQKAFEME